MSSPSRHIRENARLQPFKTLGGARGIPVVLVLSLRGARQLREGGVVADVTLAPGCCSPLERRDGRKATPCLRRGN